MPTSFPGIPTEIPDDRTVVALTTYGRRAAENASTLFAFGAPVEQVSDPIHPEHQETYYVVDKDVAWGAVKQFRSLDDTSIKAITIHAGGKLARAAVKRIRDHYAGESPKASAGNNDAADDGA